MRTRGFQWIKWRNSKKKSQHHSCDRNAIAIARRSAEHIMLLDILNQQITFQPLSIMNWTNYFSNHTQAWLKGKGKDEVLQLRLKRGVLDKHPFTLNEMRLWNRL